jgi:Ca2+:H+ antiporter
VVIASLAVFSLIIPNCTKTEPDPSQAPMKAVLFASITVLFYVVFVIIQTVRHKAFFAEPSHSGRIEREHDALHGGSGRNCSPFTWRCSS